MKLEDLTQKMYVGEHLTPDQFDVACFVLDSNRYIDATNVTKEDVKKVLDEGTVVRGKTEAKVASFRKAFLASLNSCFPRKTKKEETKEFLLKGGLESLADTMAQQLLEKIDEKDEVFHFWIRDFDFIFSSSCSRLGSSLISILGTPKYSVLRHMIWERLEEHLPEQEKPRMNYDHVIVNCLEDLSDEDITEMMREILHKSDYYMVHMEGGGGFLYEDMNIPTNGSKFSMRKLKESIGESRFFRLFMEVVSEEQILVNPDSVPKEYKGVCYMINIRQSVQEFIDNNKSLALGGSLLETELKRLSFLRVEYRGKEPKDILLDLCPESQKCIQG